MTLLDSFGRSHSYLRVSVTDRCNFRCVYCLPEEGLQWTPKSQILSYEEIARLVHIFADLGIRKIRLTGGEPTMRADICHLVSSLSQIRGITDVNMTTNGYTLPKLAKKLYDAGLKKMNVSLDTLDPEVFHALSRGFSIDPVLRGLSLAKELGYRIKLNAVLLKGINEESMFPLIEYCAKHDFTLRFIEYMPFEARWHQCLSNDEIRKRISKRYTLQPMLHSAHTAGPAQQEWIVETGSPIGFISPLSNRFCSSCNRLRLSAKGELRTCLAHEDAPSLGSLLRRSASDEEIKTHIRMQVQGKKEGHFCEEESGTLFEGVMTRIGG